jgi:hypothetical protein
VADTTVQNDQAAFSGSRRILAVADTDSYLKWSSATLSALPPGWRRSQLVIRNPVMPSAEQMQAVSSLPVEVLSRAQIIKRIRAEKPDAVLLACTGPAVATLAGISELRDPDRPVLVTGLPGVSVPASPRAISLRRACDLFLLHSQREIAEFRALGERLAPGLVFGLAGLPFLTAHPMAADRALPGTDLIFAAQAKVPAKREHREQILLALAAAGSAVVKVRGEKAEQQTHHEQWPYVELIDKLMGTGRIQPGALRVRRGSMSDALRTAKALVTVSSTAALEAMAAGVPVLIISDFGVSAEMINLVFADSGCLRNLSDLDAGNWSHPDPSWLTTNYFHPPADNGWLDLLDGLVATRLSGPLPVRPRTSGSPLRRMRRRLRLLVQPAWAHRLRRFQRRMPAIGIARQGQDHRVPVPHLDRRGVTRSAELPYESLADHRPPRSASPPPPSPQDH